MTLWVGKDVLNLPQKCNISKLQTPLGAIWYENYGSLILIFGRIDQKL